MFFFAVDTLEGVRARFVFFGFESEVIGFEVNLTTLCYSSMMFYLIETIILDISRSMSLICKNHVFCYGMLEH